MKKTIKNHGKKIYDVIIIGAGFSGLAAALKLKEKKLKVLILEADDDYGGRSFNRVLDNGTLIELGGQWVGWQHERMLHFVKKYKIKKYTTPPFAEGRNLVQYGDQVLDEIPQDFSRLASELDKLASEIDLEKPWTHKNAKFWDNITFEHWLELQDASYSTKKLLARVVAGGLLSKDASHVSMLQTLFYVASNAGFDAAVSSYHGAQHYRLIGGSYQLAKKMVEELKTTKLLLNEPVTIINYHQDEATVLTMSNNVFQAKRVIIAIPPVLASRIHFHPSLGANYYGLLQNFPGGDALKVHFVYERPFWRLNDLSGVAILQDGWMTELTDNTTPNSPYAVLTGFIYGNKKRELTQLSHEEKKLELLKQLVLLFGDEANDIIEFVEYDWLTSPWTGGCFAGSLRIGCWSSYGPYLRKPIASLHWASTEMSIYFNGYFEGAVRSGERAAQEVIAQLKPSKNKGD